MAQFLDKASGRSMTMAFGIAHRVCDGECGKCIPKMDTRFMNFDFDMCFGCMQKRNPDLIIPETHERVRIRWHKHRMFTLDTGRSQLVYQMCNVCKKVTNCKFACLECDVFICSPCSKLEEEPLADDDRDINDCTRPGEIDLGTLKSSKRPRRCDSPAPFVVDISQYATLQ